MAGTVHPALDGLMGYLVQGIPVIGDDTVHGPNRAIEVAEGDVFRSHMDDSAGPDRAGISLFLIAKGEISSFRRFMAEIGPGRHVLAVISGDPGKLVVPAKGRKAVGFAFSVDEDMNALFEILNADGRLRYSLSLGNRAMRSLTGDECDSHEETCEDTQGVEVAMGCSANIAANHSGMIKSH